MVKLARQRVGLFPSPTDDASRSRRGHSWWKGRQPGNVAGWWGSSLATVLSRVREAVLRFRCTRIAPDTYPGSIGSHQEPSRGHEGAFVKLSRISCLATKETRLAVV
jgi:hypothetical protein